MNAVAPVVPARGLPAEGTHSCKVAVFFENAAVQARALHVCERLLAHFSEDLDFEFGWWKLSRLTDAAFARRATRVAAAADLVLFCTRRGEVPLEAADWLESWTEFGPQDGGAVALVAAEPPSPASELTISRLERAAGRLGLEFIRVTPPTPTPPAVADPDACTRLSTAPAADLAPPHLPPWGLNE